MNARGLVSAGASGSLLPRISSNDSLMCPLGQTLERAFYAVSLRKRTAGSSSARLQFGPGQTRLRHCFRRLGATAAQVRGDEAPHGRFGLTRHGFAVTRAVKSHRRAVGHIAVDAAAGDECPEMRQERRVAVPGDLGASEPAEREAVAARVGDSDWRE